MGEIISIENIKKLRKQTGIGLKHCRDAFHYSKGNYEGALEYIKNLGLVDNFSSRETFCGRIESYIHHNHRIGVLVKICCQTDFAANTDEFKEFCTNLSYHITAKSPRCIHRDELTDEDMEEKSSILRQFITADWADDEIENFYEEKFEEWYKEVCLLDQAYLSDESRSVSQVLNELTNKLGEKIYIVKFIRFEI